MTDMCTLANGSQAIADGTEIEAIGRMHAALKAAWKYVNIPMVSDSARSEVGRFVQSPPTVDQRIPMLFALQTAWTFVHGSGDAELLAEFRFLLGHGMGSFEIQNMTSAEVLEEDRSPFSKPGM